MLARYRRAQAWWTSYPIAADVALAIGMTVMSIALSYGSGPSELTHERAMDPLGALLAAGAILPLALRRRAPATVLAANSVLISVSFTLGYPAGLVDIAFLIAVYSIATHRPLARSLAVTVAASVLMICSAEVSTGGRHGAMGLTVGVALIGFVWWLGRSLRLRRAYTHELEARAARLSQAQDAYARAALAEERSRIARELHDVVAHHVSVMTVQAAAAQRILAADPDGAREALRAIETTGRGALGEMRRMVGVLRTDARPGTADASRTPQPGVADLPDLVDQLRETGLAVDLRIGDGVSDLPTGVDLAAYRIVQEALTNALKHAGAAAVAAVQVRRNHRHLVIEVIDDGRGWSPNPAGDPDRPGHGLVGMRERVTLYGGDLRIGPRPEGGFEVRANFPLDQG